MGPTDPPAAAWGGGILREERLRVEYRNVVQFEHGWGAADAESHIHPGEPHREASGRATLKSCSSTVALRQSLRLAKPVQDSLSLATA